MENSNFIICSQCGAENPTHAQTCRMCINPINGLEQKRRQARAKTPDLLSTITFSTTPTEPLICLFCEQPNDQTYKFCCNCGRKLHQPDADIAPDHAKTESDQQQNSSTLTLHNSEGLTSRPHLIETLASTRGCPKCEQPLVEGSAFCHKCGTPLSAAQTVLAVSPQPRPRLLLILEGEQTGDEYEVKNETVIGRIDGDIIFPHDDYMSGRHARIEKRDKKFVLIDEDSRNGSFIRIKKEVEIEPGDMILIGKQIFRFEI